MRDTVTGDLSRAFDNELADAVTEFTGQRAGDSTYDPATGTYTSADALTYYGRGIIAQYSRYAVERYGIPRADRQLLALQRELTDKVGKQVVPAVGDVIAGMRVKDILSDPVDATYEIQLEGPA